MQKKRERLLTETELELMCIVWRLGQATVREVRENLPEGRDITYTSVAKILSILEEKGALGSKKGEKTYLYYPRIAKEDYESRALRHVTQGLFDGNPGSLVMRLLDGTDLSREDLAEIRKTIEARLDP
ncbi:BlaI/MecI/CopY family transcriptional regulator [bacterium]|nr:BlaI/MecI/CopY family transcriptional regulator [bacterium]